MIKICFQTDMAQMPANCVDCAMCGNGCKLPLKRNSRGGVMLDSPKVAYTSKRHEDCPLCEVDVEVNEKASYDNMLDLFKIRMPEGLEVVSAKKRGDKYKLLLMYDGTEYATELRAVCPPKEENNVCDYTISVAMMAIALKREDFALCKKWRDFQDSVFARSKK